MYILLLYISPHHELVPETSTLEGPGNYPAEAAAHKSPEVKAKKAKVVKRQTNHAHAMMDVKHKS